MSEKEKEELMQLRKIVKNLTPMVRGGFVFKPKPSGKGASVFLIGCVNIDKYWFKMIDAMKEAELLDY